MIEIPYKIASDSGIQRLVQTHDAAGQLFHFLWYPAAIPVYPRSLQLANIEQRIYIMIILESCMKRTEAKKMSKNDDKAFDTKVALGDGSELFLSDLWKKQPLVLIFLRHLG
jgi:hypothetical protein